MHVSIMLLTCEQTSATMDICSQPRKRKKWSLESSTSKQKEVHPTSTFTQQSTFHTTHGTTVSKATNHSILENSSSSQTFSGSHSQTCYPMPDKKRLRRRCRPWSKVSKDTSPQVKPLKSSTSHGTRFTGISVTATLKPSVLWNAETI